MYKLSSLVILISIIDNTRERERERERERDFTVDIN